MATYESETYVATEYMWPGEKRAFVHIWNSAASISQPVSKVWSNRQDVTANVLTGSDSSAQNVQTGKFFEAPSGSWGRTYVYTWQASVEGQTLIKALKIIINSLPRGA